MTEKAAVANTGVIYVATGEVYVAAAAASARSVRACSPALSIHLFTDCTDEIDPVFDRITTIDRMHRRSKVDCLADSPYDRTLYLDADTRVVADISEMFRLLDRFDLALAHAHRRDHPGTREVWKVELPESFPQLNSGVLLFRRNQSTLEFFRAWRDAYHEAGFAKDQVTLRELAWSSRLRLHVLPPEYNIRYAKYPRIWDPGEARPRILHYREYKGLRPRGDLRGVRGAITRIRDRLVKPAAPEEADR